MSLAAKPATRRTLPAPSEPINVEQLIADRDRLIAERDELLARLEARESAAREAVFLMDEVARLRDQLARSRDEPARSRDQATREREPQPVSLPRPSPLPRGLGAALYPSHEIPTGRPRESAPQDGMGLDFGTVSRLSPAELDKLPYGLICLDAQGRVVHYNDTESRLAQLPKERVIGRSFFGEVAPCARVREFEGEFKELVRDPSTVRVRSFDFIFRFRHSEQHVTIVMTPARQRGLYNIALLRRSVTPKG
jgi:photoactive yellow protein